MHLYGHLRVDWRSANERRLGVMGHPRNDRRDVIQSDDDRRLKLPAECHPDIILPVIYDAHEPLVVSSKLRGPEKKTIKSQPPSFMAS